MYKNVMESYLLPEQDVERVNGFDVAQSSTPWMRIEPIEEILKHRWIEIGYQTSLFDDPVRPMIRFVVSDGPDVLRVMNGPIMGTAQWVDRIPKGTTQIWISPTNSAGTFRFEIQAVRGVSRANILIRALRADAPRMIRSLFLKLIHENEEARHDIRQALNYVSLVDYAAWVTLRSREWDLLGIDRPRTDWQSGPTIRFFMLLEKNDANALERTIRSLQSQLFPNWALYAVQTSSVGGEISDAYRRYLESDSRCHLVKSTDRINELAAGIQEDDLFGTIAIGDILPEYTAPVLIEAAAANPGWSIIYGDDDAINHAGHLHSPIFKPNFAPHFQTVTDYIGSFVVVRAAFLRSQCNTVGEALSWRVHNKVNSNKVGHVRRVLYRRHVSSAATAMSPKVSNLKTADLSPWPSVSIIIPTRNVRLLAECLRGIRESTDYLRKSVVVVDNCDASSKVPSLLQQLQDNLDVSVVRRPGPFNFSEFCNWGAARGQADVLVFLNDDIAINDPRWLKSLVCWAVRSDVGAVGAKLLLPNGRVQHAGVVLGLQGYAGHPYFKARQNDRGYLNQLDAVREVMAVTGACLAVERRKFEAVGGFDADNLPILLNDTDLCLRLLERGWKSMWTPDAVLYHHESSSRGHDHSTSERHQKERAYFMKRWSHWVRDDPYFHPAFSLLSHSIGLA